jgi:uncharacterized lipoprotein YmbA
MPVSVVIGIGPVKIPEYQDRPQIVTQDQDGMLKFSQLDRWGESLDRGLERLIRENLSLVFPMAELAAYPWNQSMPVKYQVLLNIVQLDSELEKDLILVVQWQLIKVQSSETVLIKSSEFRQPIIPHDYPGLTQALSKAFALLSFEIAEALARLENHP